jgi:hypothetical protein
MNSVLGKQICKAAKITHSRSKHYFFPVLWWTTWNSLFPPPCNTNTHIHTHTEEIIPESFGTGHNRNVVLGESSGQSAAICCRFQSWSLCHCEVTGRHKRTAHVHQVPLKITQNSYRNLRDVKETKLKTTQLVCFGVECVPSFFLWHARNCASWICSTVTNCMPAFLCTCSNNIYGKMCR